MSYFRHLSAQIVLLIAQPHPYQSGALEYQDGRHSCGWETPMLLPVSPTDRGGP